MAQVLDLGTAQRKFGGVEKMHAELDERDKENQVER
jgi:hypothetical protein